MVKKEEYAKDENDDLAKNIVKKEEDCIVKLDEAKPEEN